jgi:hypothetical protein
MHKLPPRLLICAVALAAAGSAATPAAATPVKCADGDSTPDGRVFPEADVSSNFLRIDELECGVAFLESRYPRYLETRTIGKSKGERPLYDVVMTDEQVRTDKRKLLVVSSIHGDEVGGREGAARVIEDMVDPKLLHNAANPWVQQVLSQYEIHLLFPNPDGWAKGDVIGSYQPGVMATRGNDSGRDLNRQFPVKGWIDFDNAPLAEPEGNVVMEKLFSQDDWYLGTDNHGQGPDSYAAAGLQIVGQFNYQKSETLARFADGITESMAAYGVLEDLAALRASTGQDLGPYHWGTLYDMLGYSASGSMIDYYNTASGLNGTGFATELTVGREVNWLAYPASLNQVWVDSIRAINYTMFKHAVDPKKFTFKVRSKAAYVYDPQVITDDDKNGAGPLDAGEKQAPYRVTRMRFFKDLNRHASRRVRPIRVKQVLRGRVKLKRYQSLVLANDAMPEGRNATAWYGALKRWVRRGGNLIVTDAAAKPALSRLGLVPESAISMEKHYVGFVDFGDRSHPLNAGLRGVASQTYDTVPIGYRFGEENSAPNWKVESAAWEENGGVTLGTNGTGQTIYGEKPLGKGRVRFLGALLPDPSEEFDHPYGLQNYAVTYTGYTLLQNMLRYRR